MNITDSPQFHLYLLTLHFLRIKNLLLPKNCDKRCVDATIINRAYYSSYLYCLLWLEKVHGFNIKSPHNNLSSKAQIYNENEKYREKLN